MEIAKIDKSNMRQLILDFPKQFRAGIELAKNVKARGRFDAVLICGMGGSALPGDILSAWLRAYEIALPLYIHRNYGLPHHVDEKYLIICISYSGNTEETLSSFEEARSRGFKIIGIGSNGKLAKLCKKYNIPMAIIPKSLQPRVALGFQFAALMKILANCGIIRNNLENIADLEKSLKPKTFEHQGKNLAKKIEGNIPIIYASEKLKVLSQIWKIQFNENSKNPAFYNYFPELNHNEMVGFTKASNFHIVNLRDPADHPKNLKRMELTAEILKKRGLGVDIINIKGKDILYKIFSTIILGSWTSYYLALGQKTDPTPVKMVEEFKRKIL